MAHRLVVVSTLDPDPSSERLTAAALALGVGARIRVQQLVHLDAELDRAELDRLVEALLVDPVHRIDVAADDAPLVIETGPRPGVTDVAARELVQAARRLGIEGVRGASIGARYLLEGIDRAGAESLVQRLLVNPVVEHWSWDRLEPTFVTAAVCPPVELVPLTTLDRDGLVELDRRRGLSLDVDELVAIRDHFAGLGREPTDAEVETLAQTWSEHCVHKTFRAEITLDDGRVVDGLLPTLRSATEQIDADWVVSAFVDDAGIVALDGGIEVAVKVETHNHPSAIEPFGGANTGVGGVVRDVLGTLCRPVALTDVLCFGPTDLDHGRLADGVLHPARVRDGVVAGIGDYGNKLGVPTVAGAVIHDPGYTSTPLVFAGCMGVRPAGSAPEGTPRPGDRILVIGGAVGRDGVGGATFSSRALEVDTHERAGSSVQIGAPITEKGLIEVIDELAGTSAVRALTDCGAGGLSSAVGELAEGVGARVELDRVPLKYLGLAPWEVWLSEAQERMVLAVAPDRVDEVAGVAERHQVTMADIGSFTGDRRLLVVDDGQPVVDLDLDWLHGGRPRRHMRAVRPDTTRAPRSTSEFDAETALLGLLAHPSLCSREPVVRTYDHEVRGATLVRPTTGRELDAPSDGTVVVPPGSPSGLALGIGVNARWGLLDAAAMAWSVIDEAIRNLVAVGADPDRICLLDNFAWGDPSDPVELGRLVAAVEACAEASLAYGAPFVSGKDSLNNVHRLPDGSTDPVPPTLVITAMGVVPRAEDALTTDPSGPGLAVYLVGAQEPTLGGSHLDLVMGGDGGGALPAPDRGALERYRGLHRAMRAGLVDAAHDLAEGGLAVAAAEMVLGGWCGMELDLTAGPEAEVCFGEANGRLLVTVAPEHESDFAALVPDAVRVGATVEAEHLSIAVGGRCLIELGAATMRRAHAGGESR